MIIRHLCHALDDIFPVFLIGSRQLRCEDVLNSAMFFIQTVCLSFAIVTSYKLYHIFNGYFFPASKKSNSSVQVMTKSSNDLLSIALHHGVNAEGQLYRLKRGTKLRLVPGPSLLGRNVALYCNYPVTGIRIFQ